MNPNICMSNLKPVILVMILGLAAGAAPAAAQTSACDGFDCDNLPTSICDPGGFRITQTGYTPGNATNSGMASYAYEICSPPEGVCSGDGSSPCLSNDDCTRGGNPPGGTCSRDCAVDTFRGLSHFDVFFPELGGLNSCLSGDTEVSGSCACTGGSSTSCSVSENIVLGDGSCYSGGAPVAKCDETNLEPGDCIEMTINIAGELTGLGLGTAVVTSKESTDCNESCLAGPSCDACDEPPSGAECLTRTRGFWATHPHIIQSSDPRSLGLLPITVCGVDQATVDAGTCGTSEALCTNAKDRRGNPTSLTLVAQLTAAKLNLATTGLLIDAAACGDGAYADGDSSVDSPFEGWGIGDIISSCEANYCDANKQNISRSGCIEALDAFNNSQDTGFDETPFPFDRPGPALIDECQTARGNGISNYSCQ